jgi:hypothetical protein
VRASPRRGPRLTGIAACLALALPACEAREAADAGGSASESVASVPSDEVERLRALGYVDVVEDDGDALPGGVRQRDAARMQRGPTFYTSAHRCTAELIGADGERIRAWSHAPCLKWDNTVLLPSGEVLAVHYDPNDGSAESYWRNRKLLKLGWEGELLWSRDLPVHHDVDVMPDGRIAALTYRHRVIPRFDESVPVRDHYIAILSSRGELEEQESLTELLERAPEVFRLQPTRPQDKHGIREIDLIHSNSIEWMRRPELAERHPLYAASNVLVCLRNQDAVVVIDWERRRPVWSWGPGELSGPHDATVLPNGNFLVFDNGLDRKRSRVVELDPRTREIVWSYDPPPPARLFTAHRGASQRLPNGNALVTDSGRGRVFEVTREGELVWDFWNPNESEEGKRIVVVRARRVPAGAGDLRFGISD